MKRILLLLLICIYSLTTLGFSVKQFYCCNKLKSSSISFLHQSEQTCKMGKKMVNCCKTTYRFFKVKDTHLGENIFSGLPKFFAETDFTPLFVCLREPKPTQIVLLKSYTPLPRGKDIPIYIFGSVYRI